jgi:hypothetical protein
MALDTDVVFVLAIVLSPTVALAHPELPFVARTLHIVHPNVARADREAAFWEYLSASHTNLTAHHLCSPDRKLVGTHSAPFPIVVKLDAALVAWAFLLILDKSHGNGWHPEQERVVCLIPGEVWASPIDEPTRAQIGSGASRMVKLFILVLLAELEPHTIWCCLARIVAMFPADIGWELLGFIAIAATATLRIVVDDSEIFRRLASEDLCT